MIGPSVDRAQTESLGSLLLVAVVVVSAGTFGAYYVASTGGEAAGGTDSPDEFDIAVEATQDELRLAHNGGSSVPTAGLRVTVENASGEFTYAFDDGTLRGDDRFDAGETWRFAWDQPPNAEVTVSLVDTGTSRLLFRGSVTVGSPATERPADLAVGDETDGALGGEEPGEAGGGDSDDSPDTPSEPWLDFDDDGVFEPDTEDENGNSDVPVDLSGGTVPYANASAATLRVPAGVSVDAGNDKVELTNSRNVSIAGEITTRNSMKIEPSGYVNLDGGSLSNVNANAKKSIEIKSGNDLTADGLSLRSKGPVSIKTATGPMALSSADIDNTGADSEKSVTIESNGALTADSLVLQTGGSISIKNSNGKLSLADADIDNAGPNGEESVTITSADKLAVSGASVRATGSVSLGSSGTMDLSNADVDNSAGQSSITLTVNTPGNVSLVNAAVTSSSSATATVQSVDYEVDVTDAELDSTPGRYDLDVSPDGAVTGEPASGTAG